MPLDRFKHYGKSVRRIRNLLEDGLRISFADLLQINLGAVLAEWGVPQRPQLEYIDMIIKIISTSEDGHSLKSIEWSSLILDPSLGYIRDSVKGDALFDLDSQRQKFVHVDDEGRGLFGPQRILTLQSLLVSKAQITKFLLYLFNQQLSNIQDALILGSPEVIRSKTSYQEICYCLTQIQQSQSPETTIGGIIQQGSLKLRLSRDFNEQLPHRFLHDDGMEYHVLVGDPTSTSTFAPEYALDQYINLQDSSYRHLSVHALKWCLIPRLYLANGLPRSCHEMQCCQNSAFYTRYRKCIAASRWKAPPYLAVSSIDHCYC